MNAKRSFVVGICLILLGTLFLSPQGTTFASSNPADQSPNSSQQQDNSSKKKFEKKDIPRAQEYMKSHEKLGLPPKGAANRSAPEPSNSYFVQPILFIASDMLEEAENGPSINETFQLLTRWYSGALELNNSGYSFQLVDAMTYHASQPFSYYKCPNHAEICNNYDGIWGNIQDELRLAEIPIWSEGTAFVVFVKGAGGWAGANSSNYYTNWPAPGPASKGGFAILGDWALDAITGTTNEECFANMGSACYQDPQRGAVGHELGHAFGLAHAMDIMGSLMSSWWDFPFNTLFGDPGNDEKGVLRNDSLFFTPHACTLDAQPVEVLMPASVKTRTQFTVSFTVTNYGFCHWAPTTIGLFIVQRNVWGIKQQLLNETVYPAQPYTFTLILTAPDLKGSGRSASYESYWQMRSLKRSFGPLMGNIIVVTQ